jgi:hypothetical protein
MTHRTAGPPGATVRMTDAEREELSRKVAEANKRSEQGRGGGQ